MASNTYINQTAQFQGNIVIPLFRSAFNVAEPSGNGFDFTRAMGSDEATSVVGNTKFSMFGSSSALNYSPGGGLGNAQVQVMRPAGAASLQVNGGGTNAFYFNQGVPLHGVLSQGVYGYADVRYQGGVNNLYQAVAGMLEVSNNIVAAPPGSGMPEVNTMVITQASPQVAANYMQRINAQVTIPGAGIIDGDNPVGMDVYGFVAKSFNGSGTQDYYTVTIPGYGDQSIKPPFTADNFQEGNFYNIPGVRGQNYAWSVVHGSVGLHMYSYYCNLDVVGGIGLTFSGIVYNIIPSDPVLASHFINNAIVAGIYNTANGIVLQDTVSGIDYYFSADGSKYWSLSYAMYASGVAPITRMSQLTGFSSIYFDKNGIAWVAPANTVSAGLSNPLWSNGISIPYGFGQLPSIQPLSFPCWSACLDRIGGSPGMLAPGVRG